MNRTLRFSRMIFAVALLLRAVTLSCVLPKLKPDTDLDNYRSLATHLAAGQGFVAETSDGRILPNVARTPVYPLFLATLIKLGGNRLGLFLAVQCLLGALTCALTFILALRWLRSAAATFAGLLVAIDPNSILRCSDLRTETLFTALLLTGTWLIVWRPTKVWTWFSCGFLWSLAALTRPIAVWIWLVALLIILLQRSSWRGATACLAAFLIGYLPLEAAWAARNHALTGRCFISTISTYNLLMYRAAGIQAAQQGKTLEEAQQEFRAQYGDIQFVEDRDRFERSLHDYQRIASQKLFSAPLLLAKQVLVGGGKLLLGPGTRALDTSLGQTEPSSRWWPPLYSAALLAALLLSLVGVKRLGVEALVPLLVVVYFVCFGSGPESNSRFRVPITPLLAVLATAGVCGTEKRE
jgi:4-amino-4-deoxy-L-arabinose transferase-like glycosyltransferase